MDYGQPMDFLPIWAVYLLSVLLELAFVEAGYQLGRIAKKRSPQELAQKEENLGTIAGATFSLAAFLLVFLIGIAGNRFDNRRQLAIEEATALRTCYLRAGYLDEPYPTDIRQLLFEYVDIRLAAANDPSKIAEATTRSQEIHSELWKLTENLARANPSTEVVSLFIDSVNEVITLHTQRIMAISLRIPLSAWLVLFVIISLAFAVLGFQNGSSGNRNPIAVTILCLVFAGVVLLLVDLDRAQEGLFNVSQQALIDLMKQMSQ